MKQLSPSILLSRRSAAARAVVLLSATIVTTLFFVACKSGTTDVNSNILGSNGQTTTTTIYGRILDESGMPLAGVQISAASAMTTTDQRGYYILRNVVVPRDRALIIAKKSGYFDAAKAEPTGSGGVTRIETSMMSDATTATVSSASGGTVNIAAGGSVAFQAGSFVDASGTAYSGPVSVAARYLDPKNVNYYDFFAGDLDAQTSGGSDVSLVSSGVLRVRLRGSAGQSLSLAASKPATLTFPKPIDPKAPTTMPLWYFDENLGKWKQDGSATLTGGSYVGTVTHFTDWNLDYYDSSGHFGVYGDVSLRVVCNGMPIGGVVITIVGDDAPGKYFVHPGGKTGPDGKIHFLRFPANRPTVVDIRSDRNNGVYYINNPVTVNITPGQSLDLGDINLDSPCPAAIKGTLTDCGDTAAEGLVIATAGTATEYLYTKSGAYTLQVPSATPISVDGMNVNGEQGTTISVPALAQSELRDIGSLKICGSGVPTYLDIPLTKMYVSALKLSPDGSRLAVASTQPSSLNIYDTKTGTLVSSASLASNYYVSSMEFSTDNTRLMVTRGSFDNTDVYDLSTSTATKLVSIPGISSPHLYDDGTKLIASKSSGSAIPPVVNIYSVADGSVTATLHPSFTPPYDTTGTFALVRDENNILFSDYSASATDHVWSVGTDAEVRNFAVTGTGSSMIASEDGLTVGHSSDYTTWNFYDEKTSQKISSLALTGVTGANTREGGFALTKNFIYTGEHSPSAVIVRITNIASGAGTIRLLSDSTGYVRAITASRDESTLAAAGYTSLRIWKMK